MVETLTETVYSLVMDEPTQEELIKRLDPGRDYGERTFQEVLDGIGAGELEVVEGVRLPVIRSTETNLPVKGSGAYAGTGNRADWLKKEFETRATEDFQSWYDALKDAGMKGDVRAMKIYFEHTLGRPKEVSSSQLPELFTKLLELGSQSYDSTQVYDVETDSKELPEGETE